MPGLVLAAMLAVAQQSPAPAPQPNLVFARGDLGGWSMRATNVVDDGPSGPTINRTLCEIERGGLRATTWRQGNVVFSFDGAGAGGARQNGLVRALVIDGVGYEAEWRDRSTLTDRYTDVAYPDSQPIYPPNGLFSLAVRRQGSDLWLGADNITNELIDARRLRVGFRTPETGHMLWIEVPMTGLPAALSWCHAAMTAPNALRLHPS